MELNKFIVHYPRIGDKDYIRKMGAKREFRELLVSPRANNADDKFFYNYQMLPARWIAPWTNNRALFIRWDPGTGKTRGSLAASLMWMAYSDHKNVLFLADSDIVHRSLVKEVVEYNNYGEELKKRTFKQGRRAHGKTLAQVKYVKKMGFVKMTIMKFMTARKAKGDNWRELLREEFKNYVIVIDEVHTLRSTSSKRSRSKPEDEGKKRYNYTIELLDTLRDVCPIILMSATPAPNTWKDIFSILGMLHPKEVRDDIADTIGKIDTYTSNEGDIKKIEELLDKYAIGIVSDRKALDIVPSKLPIAIMPGTYPLETDSDQNVKFTIFNDETGLKLPENFYPVFMSKYQTEITMREEDSKGGGRSMNIPGEEFETEEEDVPKQSFYTNLREHYDFTPPRIEVDGRLQFVKPSDLIYEDNDRYFPSEKSKFLYEDETEEQVFKVEWGGYMRDSEGKVINRRLDTTRGLAKYSMKYAELIRMLTYHPDLKDKAGYVHTLWVKVGTKLIAAALNANGWEQYTGKEPLSAKGSKPRFALIHGESGVTEIDRIIEAFNSENNRDGSILRVVIGSKKSGISISFINARFFIELSPDFNKATRIQSEGRVFRANSLLWLPEGVPRAVYTADLIALPSIIQDEEANIEYIGDILSGNIINKVYESVNIVNENGEVIGVIRVNPATVEIRMYYLSDVKFNTGQRVLNKLASLSIENIVMNSVKEGIPTDNTTHALLFSGTERDTLKRNMLNDIATSWASPLNPKDMYQMRAVADLMNNHSLGVTKYGYPRPVQTFGSIVTVHQGTSCVRSQCQLQLVYDKGFFLIDEFREYTPNLIKTAVKIVNIAPMEEFGFGKWMSRSSINNYKIIALETALAMPQGVLTEDETAEFMKRRHLLLSLYGKFWNTFGNNRIVHVLWYGIKAKSHLTRIGIGSVPLLKSRILMYNEGVSSMRWKYIDTTDHESVFLSSLARDIQDLEIAAIASAQALGLEYYVHFSVFDGGLRLREIRMKEIQIGDLRESKSFNVNFIEAPDVIAKILNIQVSEISTLYSDLDSLQKAVYFKSKELGILIVR